MTTQDPLEGYLQRLRSALPGMTIAEREDILEEIRTHVHERVTQSGLSVEETLARLGSPGELAAAYGKGTLVRRARLTFSPWVILRAAFAWAMTGVHGFIVFVTALLGYMLGLVLMLCGLLRPLFPEDIGLWVGPGIIEVGLRPSPDAQQVLGPWFTQASIVLGGLLFVGTTILIRALLLRLRHWRTAALHPATPRQRAAVAQ